VQRVFLYSFRSHPDSSIIRKTLFKFQLFKEKYRKMTHQKKEKRLEIEKKKSKNAFFCSLFLQSSQLLYVYILGLEFSVKSWINEAVLWFSFQKSNNNMNIIKIFKLHLTLVRRSIW